MSAALKIGTLIFVGCALPLILPAQQRNELPRRAQLPSFDKRPLGDVFFENVFEHVSGERPQAGAGRPVAAGDPNLTSTPATVSSPADSAGEGKWSQLISAAVLEDEVKAMKLAVDETVTTPVRFQSQGYIAAQNHFAMLATWFGIVAQYNGDVRWKVQAPAARDVFARSAANAQSGSIQVFNDARQRKQDLQDLVSGARLAAEPAGSDGQWSTVAERSALMRRLERAHQGNITPVVNSTSEFASQRAKLLHEAQIIAALAEVLQQPGMMDSDDDTYTEFAEQMKEAALTTAQAARQDDYQAARRAAGEISQSCSQCHELYRG